MKNLRKALVAASFLFTVPAAAQFSELATGGIRYQGVSVDTSQFSQPEEVATEETVVEVSRPEPSRRITEKVYKTETGIASNYWQPQKTGCRPYKQFNPKAMTAAHKHLKCGSRVRVTNLNNGKSVIVTINDRGPYVKGRIIDLSKGSYDLISNNRGITKVKLEVLTPQ